MKITEVFYSLQGEGTRMGRPAVFLRLAGCNLNCEWCDTPQRNTVNHDVRPEDILSFMQDTIAVNDERIGASIADFYGADLVITGGEPMLQWEELTAAMRYLDRFQHITVETNGTLCYPIPPVDLWSVSPKLQFDHRSHAEIVSTVAAFFYSRRPLQLKFVVDNLAEYDMAMIFLNNLFRRQYVDFSGTPIVIQPNGNKLRELGPEGYFAFMRSLQTYALAHGKYFDVIRILPQLHILTGAR